MFLANDQCSVWGNNDKNAPGRFACTSGRPLPLHELEDCVHQRAAGEQLNAERLVWGLDLTTSVCLSSYLEFSGTSGFSAREVLLSLPCPGMLLLFREPLVHLAIAERLPVAQQVLRRGLLGLFLGLVKWGGSSCSGSFCWLGE